MPSESIKKHKSRTLWKVTACSLALTIGLGAGITPALAAEPPANTASTVSFETITKTLLEESGATWKYYSGAADPQGDWKTAAVTWAGGQSPFGRGANIGAVSTTLPTPGAPIPLATYFRTDVNVGSDKPEELKITTWADDGVILWVNGVEAGRSNLPQGPITSKSYAINAPQSANARAKKVTFVVPASALKTGVNQIAAQVQSNWRATPNITFSAKVERVDALKTENQSAIKESWGAPVWRDEFTFKNATGAPVVDPAKWNVRDRSNLGLLFDAAVPSKDQVTVDNSGILHIKGDWLPTATKRPAGQTGPTDLWHKTGYLDQRALKPGDMSLSQTYGRWEIRTKTPTGPQTLGSLAAFWLRNGQSGEIDIMEAWGYDKTGKPTQRIDTATTTVHTHTNNPALNKKYIWHHSATGGPAKVWQDFHVYAYEYTPEYAAMIVDGKEIFRATPATHPNLWDSRYFGTPFHMRLNLHIGPSAQYWGLPDPNNKSATQPLDYQVDYVRMWEYKAS